MCGRKSCLGANAKAKAKRKSPLEIQSLVTIYALIYLTWFILHIHIFFMLCTWSPLLNSLEPASCRQPQESQKSCAAPTARGLDGEITSEREVAGSLGEEVPTGSVGRAGALGASRWRGAPVCRGQWRARRGRTRRRRAPAGRCWRNARRRASFLHLVVQQPAGSAPHLESSLDLVLCFPLPCFSSADPFLQSRPDPEMRAVYVRWERET